MLKVAGFAATYAAFALFQAVAEGQPLAARVSAWGRPGRASIRLAALGILVAGCAIRADAVGWAESALLAAVELVLAATAFVLLAAAAPRVAWGLALIAPVAVLLVVIGARALP